MLLNNKNMLISILEIDRESIITKLNKLPYMSDSRHLKRRNVQTTIKLVKVNYGPETTSMLRNNKHIGIETSTTRKWFYSSLSKQFIHFFLDNGILTYSCLNVEPFEITEQGRMRPKLQMVTLNHIKHRPVGSNVPVLIQKWESVLICITGEEDEEGVDCNISGMPNPMAPLLSIVSRTGRDTTCIKLPATLTSLSPTLKVRTLLEVSIGHWNGTKSWVWLCHFS